MCTNSLYYKQTKISAKNELLQWSRRLLKKLIENYFTLVFLRNLVVSLCASICIFNIHA